MYPWQHSNLTQNHCTVGTHDYSALSHQYCYTMPVGLTAHSLPWSMYYLQPHLKPSAPRMLRWYSAEGLILASPKSQARNCWLLRCFHQGRTPLHAQTAWQQNYAQIILPELRQTENSVTDTFPKDQKQRHGTFGNSESFIQLVFVSKVQTQCSKCDDCEPNTVLSAWLGQVRTVTGSTLFLVAISKKKS